ncbi:MAG: hypothetical protein ACSLFL_15400, partial [Alphaproteobacteria bacterium]
WLEGRDLVAAAALTGAQMAEALELAGALRGVALTVEDALRAALVAQHGAGMSTQSVRSELCRN